MSLMTWNFKINFKKVYAVQILSILAILETKSADNKFYTQNENSG